MNNQNRLALIRERLEKALSPTALEIIDESYLHKGHVGAQSGLGHFAITISSPAFADKNILECHRMIYDILGELMQTDIHALRIHVTK